MDLSWSLPAFTGLVVAVGAGRLIELAISQQRRRGLRARGAAPVAERHFLAMVLLHAGILVGCLVEAWLRARPPAPWLAFGALALVFGASILRWWVIATLGPHWNVRIMASTSLGVVTSGPYRFVRHPNYVAVFVELAALPLVHGAYLTATLGAVAHLWVLAQRISAEEEVLHADPVYRAQMSGKPRFFPRFLPRFWTWPGTGRD
jgi:methyltransferase